MNSERIDIEIPAEIEEDLKKLKIQLKKNNVFSFIYILLLIALIVALSYYRRVSGDSSNEPIIIVTLIAVIVIFKSVYNLIKPIPDISDILVQNYGFKKAGNGSNAFYKNEETGEKVFFRYYMNDTYDSNKRYNRGLSYRYFNTEFRYYLNEKSNRKSSDINADIREFIERYNSAYIPQYLRIEKCIYNVNENAFIITIKNNYLLYTLDNNKTIAKLLLLSFKESEKIISEIIRNCIYLERY